METNNQRLLHTFAALADLGQEIANTADFEEMLRASFHLLLGSLAIRRGAVAEYDQKQGLLRFIAARGLSESAGGRLMISGEDESRMADLGASGLAVDDAMSEARRLLAANRSRFENGEIDLLVPLVVRKQLIGVVLL